MSNQTAEEERVIVEFECLRKDIEDLPVCEHYKEQTDSLLRTKVATVLMDTDYFRYVNVKKVSDKQRLTALKEKLENLETFESWGPMGENLLNDKEVVIRKSELLTLIEEELQ